MNDNLDVISHRFDALGVDDRGRIVVVWLDKRDSAATEKRGEKYKGTSLYAAISDDGGASFEPNFKLADHACECCRVAIATDPDGTPVVLWRQIFGKNVRDHAMMRLDGRSRIIRASHDNWRSTPALTTARRSRSERTASVTSPGSRRPEGGRESSMPAQRTEVRQYLRPSGSAGRRRRLRALKSSAWETWLSWPGRNSRGGRSGPRRLFPGPRENVVRSADGRVHVRGLGLSDADCKRPGGLCLVEHGGRGYRLIPLAHGAECD